MSISANLWSKCDRACNKETSMALFINPTILLVGINIIPKYKTDSITGQKTKVIEKYPSSKKIRI